jgi:hypothetical protein
MVSENHRSCLTHSFFLSGFTSHVAGGIYWIWVILRRSLHRPCIFWGTRGIGVTEQKGVQHGQRLTYF